MKNISVLLGLFYTLNLTHFQVFAFYTMSSIKMPKATYIIRILSDN